MKNKLLLASIFAAAYFFWGQYAESPSPATPASSASQPNSAQKPGTTGTISPSEWRSGQQVKGSGRVIRLLPDDNDGSRHQRFIIELNTGRTLLIAHNIDLAPRVSSLRAGDTVEFNGEYEPNDRGGVIHWTHKDPRGSHEAGWIRHNGQLYQ